MKKRRKRKKLKLKKGFKFLLALCIIAIIFFKFYNTGNVDNKPIDVKKSLLYWPIRIKHMDEKYHECLTNGITENNFNDITKEKKNNILTYIKNNGILYYYTDYTYNDIIKYRENESIYGASLIKLVAALYLVDNEIDLSQTVKYEAKHKMAFSTGMQTRKIGENVTLDDLMKYTMTYSDNTAHNMILQFIGKDKLKEYGLSIGGTVVMTGWDNFGNQTAADMNVYLKKAYDLFETKPNGGKLKEYMYNHDKNALNFDSVEFAHKYGSHSSYFHDAGLYIGDHPYSIAILTSKGEERGPSYVTHLSRLTYEYHEAYYNNLEEYCKIESQKND